MIPRVRQLTLFHEEIESRRNDEFEHWKCSAAVRYGKKSISQNLSVQLLALA